LVALLTPLEDIQLIASLGQFAVRAFWNFTLMISCYQLLQPGLGCLDFLLDNSQCSSSLLQTFSGLVNIFSQFHPVRRQIRNPFSQQISPT
jgi:hypothetical protein